MRTEWYYGKNTKESCDESPTDQEHKLGDRADQAYRDQLIVRSISFGYLTIGGAHCFRSFLPSVVSFERNTMVVLPQMLHFQSFSK